MELKWFTAKSTQQKQKQNKETHGQRDKLHKETQRDTNDTN